MGGYVEIPLDIEMETTCSVLVGERLAHHLQYEQNERIPETQLHQQMETEGATYLAVFASIGLDSPIALQEKQGEDSHTPSRHDVNDQSLSSRTRNKKGTTTTQDFNKLSPLKGKIWKNKRKSPLGRK